MNKIALPFLSSDTTVNINTLQDMIDKNSYIDVAVFDDKRTNKISIFLKMKILKKNKWKSGRGMTTIAVIDNEEYVYLGFLEENNFEKESDIIRNFIAKKEDLISIANGKLVPVPADKQGDFYFEWVE